MDLLKNFPLYSRAITTNTPAIALIICLPTAEDLPTEINDSSNTIISLLIPFPNVSQLRSLPVIVLS